VLPINKSDDVPAARSTDRTPTDIYGLAPMS
jgi:hypothetical protein